MRRQSIVLFLMVAIAAVASLSRGQCPGQWDYGPDQAASGVSGGNVYAMTTWDPDGGGPASPLLVVGGTFATAGGFAGPGIATWDGLSWQSLGAVPIPDVRALVSFTGQLIAGGPYLQRPIQWTGSQWQYMSGGPANVTAFAIYNGELYASGQNGIAHWNGASWQFMPGSNGVNAISVFQGQLVAGGQFDVIGGTATNNIARWDGTAWSPLDRGLRTPCWRSMSSAEFWSWAATSPSPAGSPRTPWRPGTGHPGRPAQRRTAGACSL